MNLELVVYRRAKRLATYVNVFESDSDRRDFPAGIVISFGSKPYLSRAVFISRQERKGGREKSEPAFTLDFSNRRMRDTVSALAHASSSICSQKVERYTFRRLQNILLASSLFFLFFVSFFVFATPQIYSRKGIVLAYGCA